MITQKATVESLGMHLELWKVTNWDSVEQASAVSMGREPKPIDQLDRAYKERQVRRMHSPMRRLMFQFVVKNIPYCNAMHFVRHKVGVEWTVSSQRPDRSKDGTSRHDLPQDAPVTMEGFCNYEALVNMAGDRLCSKADKVTRGAMYMIVKAVSMIDPVLGNNLKPKCQQHGGICREDRPCGRNNEN